jgi:DHA2 family multidrug resistance protein
LRSTTTSYSNMSEKVTIFSEGSSLFSMPSAWNMDSVLGLTQFSDEVQRQASMIGYINSFHLMAVAALVAVPLIVFMRLPKK